MTLLSVHKALIAIAILLFAGFAVLAGFGMLGVASSNGGALIVLRCAAAAGAAILLGLYLRWLVRAKQGGAMAASTSSSSRQRDISERDE